jgi:hypothetical protein
LNFEYWGGLFKDVAKARNLVDAVKMLVLKPGWKPDYLGGVQPFKEVTPQSFRKYDTHIVVGLAYYIFFQFVLLLAGATGYLLVAENLEWLTKLAFALLIVVTLVTLGGLLENKRWAFFMEIFRLIVTVPVAILPLQSVVNPLAVSIVVPIIALISFAWLIPYHNVLKRAEEESAVANA